MYVDELVKLIKRKCNAETFIDWLHVLMYMDDTVLLATTQAAMLSKIKKNILYEFGNEYGMKVNLAKTKFFVINGGAGDADPLRVNDLIVEHYSSYVYLGRHFTCDGSVSAAVKLHAKNKLCQVSKFMSIIRKNNDVPFIVKKNVCLMLHKYPSCCMVVSPGWEQT